MAFLIFRKKKKKLQKRYAIAPGADQTQLVQSWQHRHVVTLLGRCTSGYGVGHVAIL